MALPELQSQSISIHALREEGDSRSSFRSRPAAYFYPRPPRGGRHQDQPEQDKPPQISIHALREEGDILTSLALLTSSKFLSTPSARRATVQADSLRHPDAISIHALREEGDSGRRCPDGST